MIIDLRLMICCFWFENGCVLEPGKTRGAIGFALIFLCFVSLYQDKEMKRKDNCFIGPFVNGDVCCSASRIWDLRLVVWMFGVWLFGVTLRAFVVCGVRRRSPTVP